MQGFGKGVQIIRSPRKRAYVSSFGANVKKPTSWAIRVGGGRPQTLFPGSATENLQTF